jgi:phosphate starvation-inducible protein PhoH
MNGNSMAQRRSSRQSKSQNSLNKINFEIQDFSPLTDNQKLAWEYFEKTDNHIMLTGYPGTGKTFVALYNAFKLIQDQPETYKRVVVVRSAVQTRDIGALPGSLEEKGLIYELPYKGVISEIFGRGDAYEILKKADIIQFLLTSYVRGITFPQGTLVVVDEIQNMTAHEAASVLTRLGRDSRIFMAGDILQRDLTKDKDKNIEKVLRVLSSMDTVSEVKFTQEDIVRSGFVKEFIISVADMYPEGF